MNYAVHHKLRRNAGRLGMRSEFIGASCVAQIIAERACS